MTFGRGHVPTLEYETGPGAGWIYVVVEIHLDHAANSSLAEERAAGKSQARIRSHYRIKPTNRITPSTSFRIMYIMFRPASHCELRWPQPPCGGMRPPRSWRLRLLIEVPSLYRSCASAGLAAEHPRTRSACLPVRAKAAPVRNSNLHQLDVETSGLQSRMRLAPCVQDQGFREPRDHRRLMVVMRHVNTDDPAPRICRMSPVQPQNTKLQLTDTVVAAGVTSRLRAVRLADTLKPTRGENA